MMLASLLPFCLWSQPGPAQAATLEIGPGDDLVGLTQSLGPGDEVVLANGNYPIESTLVISTLGTEDAPVTLRARSPGQAILQVAPNAEGVRPGTLLRVDAASWVTLSGLVLQGDETWTQVEDPRYYGLVINESSQITVRDVEVHSVNRTAVYLSGNNTDIRLEKLNVHDVADGAGIYVGCSDASCWTTGLVIDKSWVHDIQGANASGVVLSHGTQGATLTDTVIYATTRFGLYLGSTERGAENVVERNAIWSAVEAGVLVEGNAMLRNNLIFNVDGRGIWTRNPDRGSWSDLVISYNTIADTTGWAAELDDWQEADGRLVLSSNALCNPIGYGVQLDLVQADTALPDTPGYITQNVVCGLVEGLDSFAGELLPGGGYTDFSDAEGWDFYPVNGAALLDAGDPAGDAFIPETDFNGVARPGANPDAGAYEWDGDGNPGWQVQEGFKTFDLADRSQAELVGGCCKNKQADTGAALLLLPLLGVGAAIRRKTPAA